MSARVRLVLVVVAVVVGVLVGVVGAPVAQASVGHEFIKSFNGSDNPSFPGGFASPSGVAVDRSSGTVYVSDTGNKVVDAFSGEGVWQSQLTGSAEDPFREPRGVAFDQATEDLYVADPGTPVVDVFSTTLDGYLSPITYDRFIKSFIGNVAVDEATGDVLVVDRYNNSVDVFGSHGEFLSEWRGLKTPNHSISEGVFVAVDNSAGASRGDVYVMNANGNVVDVMKPGPAGEEEYLGRQLTGPHGGSFSGHLGGIAVDPGTGEVYVVDAGSDTVDQFTATGEYMDTITGPPGAAPFGALSPDGVAVAANGDVYVADGGERVVDVFGRDVQLPSASTGGVSGVGASGATLQGAVNPESGTLDAHYYFQYGTSTAYGSTSPAPPGTDAGVGTSDVSASAVLSGLASGTVYHYRLVAVNSEGSSYGMDASFRTHGEPVLDGECSENVTPTGVTLCAQVDPNGFDTTYHFEYGTSTAYGSSVPLPDGDLGAGTTDQRASVEVTGLAVETEYHYRIVATNSHGTVEGPDQTFTTLPAARIDSVTVQPESTSATVVARVDPLGSDTSVSVEYGTSTAYGSVTAAQDAGSANTDQTLSFSLSGLSMETAYHVRVVVRNALGTIEGSDVPFTTFPPALIGGVSVTHPGSSTATVVAQVNPLGTDTDVNVEYGTSTSYGSSTAAVDAGSGGEGRSLSIALAGLRSETAYHLRVVAHNALGTIVGVDVAFSTFPAAEPFRLPDGRVFEQVSPVDKGGSDAYETHLNAQASPSGDGVTYLSTAPFPGMSQAGTSQLASTYLSVRGVDGWSTRGLVPRTDTGHMAPIWALTEDLSKTVVGASEPVLAPGGTLGERESLYLGDNASGAYRLLAPAPAGPLTGFGGYEFYFAGSTADGSYITFENEQQLLPGAAPGVDNLYGWDGATGVLSLVGVLPAAEGGGAPVGGSVAGSGDPHANGGKEFYRQGSLSADGSRVVFSDLGTRRLYLRDVRTESTVPVSEGGARWLASTPDGSLVFYREGEDLYRFDVASQTRVALTSGGGVLGMMGVSSDGSYVYFIAEGALAEGATAGQPNAYVWHVGTIAFIATLGYAAEEPLNWANASEGGSGVELNEYMKSSRVSADGKTLLIRSVLPLTGYDSNGHFEIYVYSAVAGRVVCVSCSPTGLPATGNAGLDYTGGKDSVGIVASRGPFLKRNLSGDGRRVFFDTPEALVPGDTNDALDVYEWEMEGVGSCPAGSSRGCLYLISDGRSSGGSLFVDASVSGDDVFFQTRQSLVGQDQDENLDIYDARVGGGIASQNPVGVPPCSGESCRGTPGGVLPAPGVPASVSFSGVGNLTPVVVRPSAHKTVKKPRKKPRKKLRRKGRRKRGRRARKSARVQRSVGRRHS